MVVVGLSSHRVVVGLGLSPHPVVVVGVGLSPQRVVVVGVGLSPQRVVVVGVGLSSHHVVVVELSHTVLWWVWGCPPHRVVVVGLSPHRVVVGVGLPLTVSWWWVWGCPLHRVVDQVRSMVTLRSPGCPALRGTVCLNAIRPLGKASCDLITPVPSPHTPHNWLANTPPCRVIVKSPGLFARRGLVDAAFVYNSC